MEHRKTFEVVRFYDEAIDWSQSQCAAVDYAMDRDASKLAFVPGKHPVRFRFQRLTRRQWLNVVSRATSDEDRRLRAFQCGVAEIVGADGAVWKPSDIVRPDFLMMSEGDLDVLEQRFGIEWTDLQEIGGVVLTKSSVPFGSSPRYPVLPSSVAVWVAVSPRSAAPSQASAPPSSTPPEAP